MSFMTEHAVVLTETLLVKYPSNRMVTLIMEAVEFVRLVFIAFAENISFVIMVMFLSLI